MFVPATELKLYYHSYIKIDQRVIFDDLIDKDKVTSNAMHTSAVSV
jgi:hypothetical protein